MSETPSDIENPEGKKEKIPTKEEVLAAMGITLENCIEPPKELADENGLYSFEAKVKGEKEGEVIEYDYKRKGEFDGGHHTIEGYSSSGTSIHEAIYGKDGNFIKFPEHIAEYDYEKGEWINVK